MRTRAAVLVALLATPAYAQRGPTVTAAPPALPAAMEVPFAEAPPSVDREGGVLSVVTLGAADERRGPLSARRLSARRLAEQRARDSLHAYIDREAALVSLAPAALAALHAAIDAHATVVATRPRVDGSVNLRVALPLARLVEITGTTRGLSWTP